MRVTKIRTRLMEIFNSSTLPLSVQDLLRKIKANKTTIYRELEFLCKNDFIMEVNLNDNKKRYELKNLEHHHHLVCTNCKTIKDVEVKENFKIPSNFKLISHNLEFFGICQNCIGLVV